MNYCSLAFGTISLLAANVANASLLFDNVTNVPSVGFNGPADGSSTYTMGASFAAAKPEFTTISLQLAAGSASTNGSTMIYLVPDDGSGHGNGIPGLPIFENSTGTYTNLIGSQLIGAISDSSLTSTFAPVSFWVRPIITTLDQEYWIVAISSSKSSFEWSFAATDMGIGVAGQDYLNDAQTNGVPSDLLPTDNATGAYQFVIDTPEPATIAILGAGLAGLGCFRRYHSKSA